MSPRTPQLIRAGGDQQDNEWPPQGPALRTQAPRPRKSLHGATPTSPGTSNRRALERTRAPTHACALPHRLLCNSRIRGMPEVGGDGTHLCCVSRHGKWVVERPGVPRQRRSGRGRAVIEFAGGAK